jgi:phosphoribosylformylglycinamidine (FGAM) synthase PurS component
VTDVRQGKVFEVEMKGISGQQAEKTVEEIAGKVLANPIIEKFSWQVLEKE